MADLARFKPSSLSITPTKAFEVSASLQRYNLRAAPQRNGRRLFNPADQVARHALSQAGTPHQQMNVLRGSGKENRRLSGRVTSPDDRDLFIRTELRFETGGAVVDSCAFKLTQIRKRQFAILGSRRDDDRTATDRFGASA